MTFEEKTLSSEMIYSGRILNLRRDIVSVKDGKTSAREIIEHAGGAVIIAVTEDLRVPMVTQYRKAAERDVLEAPAGKLDPGEEPEQSALRELREETGYIAGRIEHLVSAYSSIGYSTEVLHFYLATELTEGETDFDESEAIDISLIPLAELKAMVMHGEIIDQKTALAIFYAAERFCS